MKLKNILLAIAAVSVMAFASSSALAGIAATKHNLGTGTGNNSTTNTGEICVFCHTPHGADTGAPVPLWNKKLTAATFTTYDQLGTSTLDAGILNVGSVSLACLTCHDGTQAIDNILNAPGSGGYDVTGGGVDGLKTADGWTWNVGGSLSSEGQFNAGEIVNLGTDLTNDHPISVQYGGGGITAAGGTTIDTDFVQPSRVGTLNRWYVDNKLTATPSIGSFDKWDFKLYTRTPGAGGDSFNNTATDAGTGAQPFVECGSCHDPHFETTTFLRMDGSATSTVGSEQSNTGSRVCLVCHNK